jgi:hypothetical protein
LNTGRYAELTRTGRLPCATVRVLRPECVDSGFKFP